MSNKVLFEIKKICEFYLNKNHKIKFNLKKNDLNENNPNFDFHFIEENKKSLTKDRTNFAFNFHGKCNTENCKKNNYILTYSEFKLLNFNIKNKDIFNINFNINHDYYLFETNEGLIFFNQCKKIV